MPGSHIMSDGWAVYWDIDQIEHGIYSHEVIYHNQDFMDTSNPDIHIKNIESLCNRAKGKFRMQYKTSKAKNL